MEKEKMKQKLSPEDAQMLEIARLAGEVVLKKDIKLFKELAKH